MDIYDNTILCGKCKKKMKRVVINKDGYELRAWKCSNCNVLQLHPLDEAKYKNFTKLKNRDFSVKLRLVGNSFCVSIPKEIISFQEEMKKKMNDMIKMSLDGPERLTLYFNNRIKKMKKIFEND